jgi:DNA-binding transcriptional LysR family regulator
MEITQCRYFLALCKEGSFTRAARRCGVAQPSLSRAIGNLDLFERRPDGAMLTPYGEKIFPYFDAISRCVAEINRGPRNILAPDGKINEGNRAHVPQALLTRADELIE